MKLKYFLVSSVLFTSSWLFSQSNNKIESFDIYDTYVLHFTVDTLVSTSPCVCSMNEKYGMENSSKNCKLYKVKINKVAMQQDSTVFKGSDIYRCQFIVFSDKVTLSNDMEYCIAAHNSCSSKYLIANKFFKEKPEYLKVAKANAYAIGLNECYNMSLIQKLLLFMGINRQRIYEKSKNRFLDDNIFLNAIRLYERLE